MRSSLHGRKEVKQCLRRTQSDSQPSNFSLFDSIKFKADLPTEKISAGTQGVIVEKLDQEHFLVEVCGGDMWLVPVHFTDIEI